MKTILKLLLVLLLILYVCVTLLSVWKLYSPKENGNLPHRKSIFSLNNKLIKSAYDVPKHSRVQNQAFLFNVNKVEVWGKAAIGTYFWIHVMNADLDNQRNAMVITSNLTIGNTALMFRTGPGLIQTTAPYDVEHLILILNGRSQEKLVASTMWLDYLPQYTKLKKLAVIILGNEECENSWIWPYMKSRGGMIDIAFLVYDSPMIDNKQFYQWPLGVAVYRGFPNILPEQVDVSSKRPFMCNFLGTVYANSSRAILMRVIETSRFWKRCILKGREKWIPYETKETFDAYMYSLSHSDLTLSPVGKNSECYRIYEAMSMGSVPVIEDVVTPGSCDRSNKSPLRLLKKHKAPVIYIKSWYSLPELLQRESRLSLSSKVERRRNVVEWYRRFKAKLSNEFIHTIENKFFGL
ncbi:hypothetical protein R5R35_002454 [Gryllus longicercus]|uniref:Uncharacterized protein n=1 Tax=Gryllus longicercus TaxID=2509291 RepID=A0AAN9Z4U7_9ORTH